MLPLQELPGFENCKVKDWPRLQRMVDEMVRAGPASLQLVSDFDFTITRQHTNDGREVLTSFGLFEKCQSLPASFKEETQKLFKKYRPIEIDPHLSKDEKVKAMIEWWTLSGKLLRGFHFHQKEIDEIAGHYTYCLRDRTDELFAALHQLNVPVLVFSAGLGHAVLSMLQQAHVYHPNMKVISNFLQLADDGTVNGFQEPMIHTFNKNETVLQGSEYYDLVHNRDHIILMGDTLADSGMANGVPATSHIIKIGFLYDHVEENLERYMNTFDIVLVDDQTMNVPLALLSLIEQPHKSA